MAVQATRQEIVRVLRKTGFTEVAESPSVSLFQPVCGGGWLRWGSVSGREDAPGRRDDDQDRLSDPQPAPSVRMRSTPIAATTMTNTAGKFARLGSSRSSPVAASNMIPGWACTAGSLSRVSPYCTGSAGSASDRKSATTSTKASSASPAPSSAGDASTTSQTVRSSKCTNMNEAKIETGGALGIRLNASGFGGKRVRAGPVSDCVV